MDTPLNNRVCIVALIGLPAAGKTTFSRWLSSLPRPFNYIHLCYDDQYRLPHDISVFAYKAQRTEILNTLQSLINAIKDREHPILEEFCNKLEVSPIGDSKDYVIVCDDNNYYRSMRYKLYQLCRDNQCAYAQIYFACDFSTASERNANRAECEAIPAAVLQQMAQRLEPPDMRRYSWESQTLTINTFEQNVDSVLSFIKSSLDTLPQPLKLQAKNVEIQTSLHRLDLLLRKRISEILKHRDTNAILRNQQNAFDLNEKRKNILHDLKNTNIGEELFSEADFNKYLNLLY